MPLLSSEAVPPDGELRAMRERAVDVAHAAIAALAVPAFAVSAARVGVIGWRPLHWIQLAAMLIVVGLLLFRRRIPTAVRGLVITLVLFALGVAAKVSLGHLGAGTLILVAAAVWATLILGARAGFALLCLGGAVVFGVGVAVYHGALAFAFPVEAYNASLFAWLSSAGGLVFFGALTVIPLLLVNRDLTGHVAALAEREEELRAANAQLRAEAEERARAEDDRRGLEEQLRHAQKLEAMGTLAAGIAHDFNNILSAIVGYADLARMDAADHPRIAASVERVLEAGDRARDLVAQILTFSRERGGERRALPLAPIVREVGRLLRATLPPSIAIRQEVAADCPPVLADSSAMHQVLMNLCTNAFHAMEETTAPEDGHVLTIGLRCLTVSPSGDGAEDVRPGRQLELFVSDTGSGMDEATRARIFDPYFTTKRKGRGTGLGLSIVHGIVATHEGALSVDTAPGEGTTFRVRLPAHAQPVEASSRPADGVALDGTERVLVVDDEAPLVELLRTTLERRGYRVSGYTDPTTAFRAVVSGRAPFDVVVTDLMMPGLSGLELLGRLREHGHAQPALVCTGQADRPDDETLRALGVTEVLAKPLAGDRVAAGVRSAVAAAATRG